MIIDFRVRPPTRSFPNLSIYPPLGEKTSPFFAWHSELPPSVRERSMPKFLAEMQEAGVTHAVIWGRTVRGHPDKSTTNEDVADIIREHRGFFSGFGGIGLPGPGDVELALEEVEHAIKGLGLKGITVEPGSGVYQTRPDHPRLYPIYERCLELGGILVFTISRNRLRETDLSYANPDAIDRVAGDFPKLPIVIGHSFWPWVEQSCGLAFRRQNVYLHPDMYGAGMPGYMHWVEAANTYLADRMLFGSAYPLLGTKAMVESYKQLPYKKGVLEKVLYHNAARLLRIS